MRSRAKLNKLYLHFHYTNAKQKCDGDDDGDLLWEISIHKFKWSFNYEVSWDRVTNWKSYISFSRRPMGTKLGKIMTYREKLSTIWSHDPLIVWLHDHLIVCLGRVAAWAEALLPNWKDPGWNPTRCSTGFRDSALPRGSRWSSPQKEKKQSD